MSEPHQPTMRPFLCSHTLPMCTITPKVLKKYAESILCYSRSIFRFVRPGLPYHLAGMLGAVAAGDDLYQQSLGVGRHLTTRHVIIVFFFCL